MNVFRRLMDYWNVIYPQALKKVAKIISENWDYFQHFKSEESMMTAVYKLVVYQKRFEDGRWVQECQR